MNAWLAPVGLPAAALATAALHCASLVALVASHPNAFTAAPAAASPPLPLPLAAYDRFLDVCHGFGGESKTVYYYCVATRLLWVRRR